MTGCTAWKHFAQTQAHARKLHARRQWRFPRMQKLVKGSAVRLVLASRHFSAALSGRTAIGGRERNETAATRDGINDESMRNVLMEMLLSLLRLDSGRCATHHYSMHGWRCWVCDFSHFVLA
jgi:hypothetical protein